MNKPKITIEATRKQVELIKPCIGSKTLCELYSTADLVCPVCDFTTGDGECIGCCLNQMPEVEYKVIEPPRWRAEHGGLFYFISDRGIVGCLPDRNDLRETEYHESGNYYRTREEAEAAAERVRAAYMGREGV